MAVKKPPESWSWSHDIKPNQIASVLTPGSRLVRLSSYGEGTARRFAAVMFPGAERSHALDLDAAALQARLADGARPVVITASADARFSVVFEHGPGALATAHVELDDAALRALVDERHAIADFATYVSGGARRYAAIVEERAAQSFVITGASAAELDAQLLAHGATLTRLRAYREGGAPRFAAIAERTKQAGWAWYADLDGDGVARQLETNAAYPYDLDATRDERGVRFTVVMYR